MVFPFLVAVFTASVLMMPDYFCVKLVRKLNTFKKKKKKRIIIVLNYLKVINHPHESPHLKHHIWDNKLPFFIVIVSSV